MALIMITHNIGVVAETADRVIVQYRGHKMEESGRADPCLRAPQAHLYPRAAVGAAGNATGDRLPTVSRLSVDRARRSRS